jgi:HD superfamily phosphohydrolase
MCSILEIEDRRREITRISALVHDIGHGPYSHLFEEILIKINGKDFSHEKITKSILENDESISNILKGNYASEFGQVDDLYKDVLNVFDKKIEYDNIIRSIISSQIDSDKLDYLRRDSYHTGSTYGIFDLERILSTLQTAQDEEGRNYIAIKLKGVPALEGFRIARYSLYTQVVNHHTRLITDQMFLRALELAIFSENSIDKNLFLFEGREKDFLKTYEDLDDYSIYDMVLNKKGDSGISVQIINDLKNRRLFKRAYENEFNKIGIGKSFDITKKPEVLKEYEQKLSNMTSIPAELIIAFVASSELGLKGYKSSSEAIKSDEMPFLYVDIDGKVKPLDEKFAIVRKDNIPSKIYVCTKQEYVPELRAACVKLFG